MGQDDHCLFHFSSSEPSDPFFVGAYAKNLALTWFCGFGSKQCKEVQTLTPPNKFELVTNNIRICFNLGHGNFGENLTDSNSVFVPSRGSHFFAWRRDMAALYSGCLMGMMGWLQEISGSVVPPKTGYSCVFFAYLWRLNKPQASECDSTPSTPSTHA